MSIKEKLYNECKRTLNLRLKVLQQTISDIETNLQSETKSSAGDKHETGRAMLQLEREKAGHQLAEIQKQFELLNKINIDFRQKQIALGSVVFTTQANYFLAISTGEIEVEGQTFFAISPATPIGKLLLSKVKSDIILFNNREFKILKVL
jgi:Fe-S cluster assembly iron-binding protein IscA